MIRIRARSFDDVKNKLLTQYNKWANRILKLEDSSYYECYDLYDIKKHKDIDYVSAAKKNNRKFIY